MFSLLYITCWLFMGFFPLKMNRISSISYFTSCLTVSFHCPIQGNPTGCFVKTWPTILHLVTLSLFHSHMQMRNTSSFLLWPLFFPLLCDLKKQDNLESAVESFNSLEQDHRTADMLKLCLKNIIVNYSCYFLSLQYSLMTKFKALKM